METYVDGLRDALVYIEEHLTDKSLIQEAAKQAYVSEFYFQRIFSALFGLPVGEYIRNRRLSEAAKELSASGKRSSTDRSAILYKDGSQKVIDISLKYGYDSPDSFTRAFTKFHGVSPSVAKGNGTVLKVYAPFHFKIILEGGTTMEFKIEEKEAFTVLGHMGRFQEATAYQEIPKFWEEHFKNGKGEIVCGTYGISMDDDGTNFDYLIADDYMEGAEVPDGFVKKTIPGGTYAVFPCTMKTLQETNTKMWTEWLPNCKEYKLGANYSIELYGLMCAENTPPEYCELWLPVVRK